MADNPTRIEHAAAHAALNQAHEHFNNAAQYVRSALDTATQMCSGSASWQGGASTTYFNLVQEVCDEAQKVVNTGINHVETGRSNLNIQTNQDQLL
jgi:Tfp pilus assembly protein PilX